MNHGIIKAVDHSITVTVSAPLVHVTDDGLFRATLVVQTGLEVVRATAKTGPATFTPECPEISGKSYCLSVVCHQISLQIESCHEMSCQSYVMFKLYRVKVMSSD